ncbi:MAG: hypothetical protein Q9166_000343 [cf. Caloplaca sp. 2 TL-2023]
MDNRFAKCLTQQLMGFLGDQTNGVRRTVGPMMIDMQPKLTSNLAQGAQYYDDSLGDNAVPQWDMGLHNPPPFPGHEPESDFWNPRPPVNPSARQPALPFDSGIDTFKPINQFPFPSSMAPVPQTYPVDNVNALFPAAFSGEQSINNPKEPTFAPASKGKRRNLSAEERKAEKNQKEQNRRNGLQKLQDELMDEVPGIDKKKKLAEQWDHVKDFIVKRQREIGRLTAFLQSQPAQPQQPSPALPSSTPFNTAAADNDFSSLFASSPEEDYWTRYAQTYLEDYRFLQQSIPRVQPTFAAPVSAPAMAGLSSRPSSRDSSNNMLHTLTQPAGITKRPRGRRSNESLGSFDSGSLTFINPSTPSNMLIPLRDRGLQTEEYQAIKPAGRGGFRGRVAEIESKSVP